MHISNETTMHLVDAFIQSDLHCIQRIHFISSRILWESNPQPWSCERHTLLFKPQENIDFAKHVYTK